MEFDSIMHIGVEGVYGTSFVRGGGRGAEVSWPNIFSIARPKMKCFARMLMLFCPKMNIWKIRGGGGGGAAAPPQPPASYEVGIYTQMVYEAVYC